MSEKQSLEIDGYKIYYKVTGKDDADTVVILQGWGTTLEVYDSVAACINEKHKVVQLDLPGFGKSSEPREGWNVDGFADFFVSFMQALDIKKATLLGHSYGGRVIIKLAARESLPFEIERIVLVDAAGVLPKKTPAQMRRIKRYKILKKIVNTKLVDTLFHDQAEAWKKRQGSADYRAASPRMRECLVKAVNEDLTELFPRVKQEVLLIWGENDTATPLSDAKVMEAKMQNAGLAPIANAGHFSFLDQPVIFRNIMRSYFKM